MAGWIPVPRHAAHWQNSFIFNAMWCTGPGVVVAGWIPAPRHAAHWQNSFILTLCGAHCAGPGVVVAGWISATRHAAHWQNSGSRQTRNVCPPFLFS